MMTGRYVEGEEERKEDDDKMSLDDIRFELTTYGVDSVDELSI
jgi:hypothetical protein